MTAIHVEAKKGHIESLCTAKPTDAIAELIWNGFDAGASKVQVFLAKNNADGVHEILVRDNGSGIDPVAVKKLFGDLGDSWKKARGRENGRVLHGKNGRGRFKAFSLGELVDWETTFIRAGKPVRYTVSGSFNSINNFQASQPVDADGRGSGTDVRISNVSKEFRSLDDESATVVLAKAFAPYLTEYPGLVLEYNGRTVDPVSAQTHREDYHLGDVEIGDGRRVPVAVTIIEWAIKSEREIHLCDADGVSLHTLPAGKVRAPGYNFTAYVKAKHFRDLDQTNGLILAGLDTGIQRILEAAKGKIKQHFRNRILEDKGRVIEKWKEENIYPYEDKESLNPVEHVERQVFDILAVNVQSYLPSFEASDQKSKRFTFRLLAQAVRDNPESVQVILNEVLGLKREEQDELAQLLRKTTLSSIISASNIVTSRLEFLVGLENLLFDKETKKKLLERDQLHKILDSESWIFGEEYGLAASEIRLDEVLEKHIGILGERADSTESNADAGGDAFRFDLMLKKALQPKPDEFDYLVVEIKRPSKKIDSDVLTQVKKYAAYATQDERLRGVKVRWTFLAISNDFDLIAKEETSQSNRPQGLVIDGGVYSVWAKTWAEIITNARSKLLFFSEQLSYRANRENGSEYLRAAHAKYIPEGAPVVGGGVDDAGDADEGEEEK